MGTAHVSPLRYPGGKGDLAPFLGRLIQGQRTRCPTYVEPFAGGAGAAVRLLFDEYVERIVLNDLDPGVAAFWRSVFQRTDDLIARIMSCSLNVAEWHRHHNIYMGGSDDDLDLGFATFFLNRTNRSGILNARPIGGLNQTGRWKIDARFNRDRLADRIRLLGRYRNRVSIHEDDGIDFVEYCLGGKERAFIYIDPPYIEKAHDLYLDTLTWNDHQRLAAVLHKNAGSWMLTYDYDRRVPEVLYPQFRCVTFAIGHTAAKQHAGREYAVFSSGLDIDALDGLRVLDSPSNP